MTVTSSIAEAGEAIVQMAYVVEDLDNSVAHWARLGAGPFYCTQVVVPDGDYRGNRGPLDYDAAFGFLGGMNIELIAQQSQTPSVYRDVLDTRGPGFHHFMVQTANYAATLERYARGGMLAAYEAELPGSGPWAYVDARPQLGCFIEVYAMQDSVAEMWSRMADAHLNWDRSTKPRRTYDELQTGELQP